jgi:hypothetical protein
METTTSNPSPTTTTQVSAQNSAPAPSQLPKLSLNTSQKAPQSKSETNSSKSETPSSKKSEASTQESIGFPVSAEAKEAAKAANSAPILGKFKTQADLEKAYTELQQQLHNPSNKESAAVSDDFDLLGAFKEAGLPYEAKDGDPASDESLKEFKTALKEEGFTPKQVSKMLAWQKEWAEDIVQKYGPQVDVAAEKAALMKAWGDEAEQKYVAVKQWAGKELPEELLTKPLLATAKGAEFIAQLMQQRSGPVPITDSTAIHTTLADLNMQVADLMARPDYTSNAVQAKVDQLIAKIEKLKR